MELIKKIANMRNERIKSTMRICGLNDMIYHLVTRSDKYMAIYEEHMDLIDIDSIRIIKKYKNTIHFNDNIHDYSFSLSKNTLLKRFDTSDTKKIFEYNTDDYKTEPFNVKLPNGKILSMKITQQGGKALMSNPNSALGK